MLNECMEKKAGYGERWIALRILIGRFFMPLTVKRCACRGQVNNMVCSKCKSVVKDGSIHFFGCLQGLDWHTHSSAAIKFGDEAGMKLFMRSASEAERRPEDFERRLQAMQMAPWYAKCKVSWYAPTGKASAFCLDFKPISVDLAIVESQTLSNFIAEAEAGISD